MTVILHISDLHFGAPVPAGEANARPLALESLLRLLATQESSWRPTVVCVTGDLAWSGKAEEYKLFGNWLQSLLEALGLPRSSVITCPGNHDLNREVAKVISRPKGWKEADAWFSLPLPSGVADPFDAYGAFCREFAMTPMTIGSEQSYLVGQRELADLSIVVLNSAWFCRDDLDRGQLWLGYPLLATMSSENQLAHLEALSTAKPTIALMHHPNTWLHDSELGAYGRPNTWDFLAQRVHLILTGHTHGETKLADRVSGAAYHLTGGATFASAYYANTVNLIGVFDDRFEVRSYQYDFRDATNAWVPSGTLPIACKFEIPLVKVA